MSETKQRSGIFKFFYIVLRILTFPIYVVVYVLKNPLWFLVLALILVGVIVYYPMSKGVNLSDVTQWYKEKYVDAKTDVVTAIAEKGNKDSIFGEVVAEAEKIKQEIEEEKIEEARPKSESYNKKIVREDAIEEVVLSVKKKSGFKKKVVDEVETDVSQENLDNESQNVGGLYNALKKIESNNVANETVDINPIEEKIVENKSSIEEDKNEAVNLIVEDDKKDNMLIDESSEKVDDLDLFE